MRLLDFYNKIIFIRNKEWPFPQVYDTGIRDKRFTVR